VFRDNLLTADDVPYCILKGRKETLPRWKRVGMQ
jgi:hypothetical protein